MSVVPAVALLSCLSSVQAQVPAVPPKLVVVIAIDQFRADYLERFRGFFALGGFNLLLSRGATFTEAHFRHGVTQTCPGHAVILTGNHANRNGIVANFWYNQALRKEQYCAADSTARLIGAGTEGRSPRNLLRATLGDQLKLTTQGRSRVVSVAGKDRSAIMLGGHRGDGVYWTEDTLFVTSTYYMKELPDWVRRFNSSGEITKYRGSTWDRLLPVEAYHRMGPDDVEAEEGSGGMGRTFPHTLGSGRSAPGNFIDGFQESPFENEVIVDFAIEAVTQEQLGRDSITDLLAIGFSANDLVGHSYGPDSHEVMDMTLRTDRQLERFFGFLATQVGLDSILVVLTADHGVAPLPELMVGGQRPVPAGRLDPAVIAAAAERELRARWGAPRRPGFLTQPSWIVHQAWPALYLNLPGLQDKRISVALAERVAKEAVEKVPGVERAITASELMRQRRQGLHSRAELSFYPGRSGNVYYELSPYIVPGSEEKGTTHGSPWAYDTHVALLWFGSRIAPGTYRESVSIADIAPTLAALIGIEAPPGSEGRVLREMLR